jgi:adenine-specific DNA-methyltransferase
VRYLGSKASTLPQLATLIGAAQPGETFCDPFGGVGVVGAHFRALGYRVHAGDLLTCAHQFQVARVALVEPPLPGEPSRGAVLASPQDMIDYLNSLPPVKSWVYREFSQMRGFFTPDNASRIDAARRELARLNRVGALSSDARAYYGACLLDAIDAVANTAGTYYAHLKSWHRKSLRPFKMSLLPIPSGPRGHAAMGDARELSRLRPWDVLYLDPPYNNRDYAGYYHLPETIATARRPRATGVSGVDASPRPVTPFNAARTAASAMTELVTRARFKLLVVHYSDSGLISPTQMRELLGKVGSIEEHEIVATGYSSSGARRVSHRVYLVRP